MGGGLNSVFSDAFVDLDLRLAAMDQQKVDCHVLSLTTPMVYFAPDDFALALSQVFNDAASRAHQRYPKRFVGMAMLPMQSPQLALRELERASRLPGMIDSWRSDGSFSEASRHVAPCRRHFSSLGRALGSCYEGEARVKARGTFTQ